METTNNGLFAFSYLLYYNYSIYPNPPIHLSARNSLESRTERIARGLCVPHGDQSDCIAGGQGREASEARISPLHPEPRRFSRRHCQEESVGDCHRVLSRDSGRGPHCPGGSSRLRWFALPRQPAGTQGRVARCRAAATAGGWPDRVGHALRGRTASQFAVQGLSREHASLPCPRWTRAQDAETSRD